MPNRMRNFIVLLASSFMFCLATFTGVHASPPFPDREVHATELRMFVPTAATCVIEAVATAHAAVLQPALGPVAPDSLVAVDGGMEYLALLRSLTCPDERQRPFACPFPSQATGPPLGQYRCAMR